MSSDQKITIEVEFVGAIRRPWPEYKRDLEVADGISVARILRELGYEDHEVSFLVVYVNGVKSKKATKVKAGDQVMVMLIVGGG